MYPGDESYEGVVLATMIHMHEGVPIYAAGATEGFDGATYGPLFYLLGEHLVNEKKPSYFPFRVVSIFAMLGCAACCGLLTFWVTGNRVAAWLSPVLFLAYGMVSGHGIRGLSDALSLFLFFSGFLVAYRLRNSQGVLLASPIMVAGFYCKPQYVAGPLAVLLFLFIEKRFKCALKFAGLVTVTGLGLFALFQWVIFGGQAFWRHFLLYQTSLLSWQLLGRGLFIFALLFLLPLIVVVGYLREAPDALISCYLFCASALGLLTFCKEAGGVHYFFECLLVICVLFSALLAKRIATDIYPLDLILLLGIMLIAGQWLTEPSPQPSDIIQHNAMQFFLRRNFPPDASALGPNPGELLQAGLKAPFSGLFELAQFHRGGVVADRDLADQIHQRRFAVIILSFDVQKEKDPYWMMFYGTPAILDAVKTDYELAANLGMPAPIRQRQQERFYVYVPRREPAATHGM
jgi:hypothetical protein